MADYSELKRKAQEIRDEVKAGANTANRVGLALEETVNALEVENKRAEQAEENLENAVQLLQDNTEDLQSIRDEVERLGSDKADKSALEATNEEVYKKQNKLDNYKEDPSNGSVEIFAQDFVSMTNDSQGGVACVKVYNEEDTEEGLIPVARMSAEKDNGDSASVTVWGNEVHIDGDAVKVNGVDLENVGVTIVNDLITGGADKALSAEMGKELSAELDNKSPKSGYAPDLKVNFAKELVGRGDATEEVIGSIRPTGVRSIGDGNATIERIKGESVVWNQLADTSAKTVTKNGVTFTVSKDDGELKIVANGKATKDASIDVYTLLEQRQSKQYLITGCPTGGSNETYLISGLYIWTANADKADFGAGVIVNDSTHLTYLDYICCTIKSGYQAENLVFKPRIHDLTQMFGAGKEPKDIEEFEARKPLGVTDEYNKGTIVSFQGGDVKSVGFNAFTAKNSEAGSINTTTGLNMPLDTAKRSDFLPCIGNVQYEFIKALHLFEYDTNRNFIKHTYLGNAANQPINKIITLRDKTHYIRVVYPTENESSICIHLVHSGYRNGDYEPYIADIHSLPDIKSIKDNNGDILFPYGLLSAGSVYDEITATKAIKRIGVVDMGSLDWRLNTSGDFRGAVPNIAKPRSGVLANILTQQYSVVPGADIALNYDDAPNKSIAIYKPTLQAFVKDTSYTTANNFKQAMSGVLLYYELATPIEVDLPEPLNMTYEAWDFGTEELVADTPTTPLNANIIYQFNAVDRIRENSTKNKELENRIEALEAMITQLTTQTTNEGGEDNEQV